MILDSRTVYPHSCPHATPLIFAVVRALLFDNLVDFRSKSLQLATFYYHSWREFGLRHPAVAFYDLSFLLTACALTRGWMFDISKRWGKLDEVQACASIDLFLSSPLAVAEKWRRRKCWAGMGTSSSHIIYILTILNILFHSARHISPWKCTPSPHHSFQSLNDNEGRMYSSILLNWCAASEDQSIR